MKEEWRDIEGYEGLYQISCLGRIKSLKCGKERILKLGSNPLGYSIVGLYKNGQQKFFTVHRIVAKTFISKSNDKSEVNHIDGNKKNNKVNNLEWTTRSENIKHAIKNGLFIFKPYVPKAKKIEQLDLNNNLIKTWNSCKEIVEELEVDNTHIYECCTSKRKTAYGYKWKYKNESVNNLERAN